MYCCDCISTATPQETKDAKAAGQNPNTVVPVAVKPLHTQVSETIERNLKDMSRCDLDEKLHNNQTAREYITLVMQEVLNAGKTGIPVNLFRDVRRYWDSKSVWAVLKKDQPDVTST